MVKHFLSNGKEVKDIKNHIVKRKDAPRVYELLERINQKGEANGSLYKRN